MRFLLILSIFAAFIGGCSSYEREQREEQQVDTFDSPVGTEEGIYRSPFERQPR